MPAVCRKSPWRMPAGSATLLRWLQRSCMRPFLNFLLEEWGAEQQFAQEARQLGRESGFPF